MDSICDSICLPIKPEATPKGFGFNNAMNPNWEPPKMVAKGRPIHIHADMVIWPDWAHPRRPWKPRRPGALELLLPGAPREKLGNGTNECGTRLVLGGSLHFVFEPFAKGLGVRRSVKVCFLGGRLPFVASPGVKTAK